MKNESFRESIKDARMKNQPVVTLLTDFGNADGFVGVMKGVILQISPNARIVDIGHDLPPFSISAAAFLNEWSYGYFPAGTVHLCVVDPGVGTRRRILVAESAGHLFVAPDNGLLTPILAQERVSIRCASNPRYWLDKISNTFHGRDIFAPVTAHLANGVPPSEMGESIDDPFRALDPLPRVNLESIDCHIHYIDRFGNLITNLDCMTYRNWLLQCGCDEKATMICFQDHCIRGVSQTYEEKRKGEILAVFNGYDRLEIAVAGGNAASITGLGIDARLTIRASKTV